MKKLGFISVFLLMLSFASSYLSNHLCEAIKFVYFNSFDSLKPLVIAFDFISLFAFISSLIFFLVTSAFMIKSRLEDK